MSYIKSFNNFQMKSNKVKDSSNDICLLNLNQIDNINDINFLDDKSKYKDNLELELREKNDKSDQKDLENLIQLKRFKIDRNCKMNNKTVNNPLQENKEMIDLKIEILNSEFDSDLNYSSTLSETISNVSFLNNKREHPDDFESFLINNNTIYGIQTYLEKSDNHIIDNEKNLI
jgi:hypothetical protein